LFQAAWVRWLTHAARDVALTGRAGCAIEAFGVAAPKAFILSSPLSLRRAVRSPPDACQQLDFENHFQEIGIIRREVIVVNHFLHEV
jgi:hypothetical protein